MSTETRSVTLTTTFPPGPRPYPYSDLRCTVSSSITGFVIPSGSESALDVGAEPSGSIKTITCQFTLVVEGAAFSQTSTTSTTSTASTASSTSSTISVVTSTTLSTLITSSTNDLTTSTTRSSSTPSTTSTPTTTTTTMNNHTGNYVSPSPSPSPSLPSEAQSTSHNSSHGLSAGALAGIAVGIAILGLLVGAAASWCILSRRRRRQKESDLSHDKTLVTPMLHPGPPSKILSTPGGSSAGPPPPLRARSEPDIFLLDGTSDSEITSELAALGHLITDHVENNYHLQPIYQDPAIIRDSLSGLGLDDWTQSYIANLSLDPRSRHIAIRSLLAHVIFSALDIRNTAGPSLLPTEVTAFVKSLPPSKSLEPGTPNAKALETWRRSSAFLLHEARQSQERSSVPLPASITPQIQNLQAALDGFLGYFVHDDSRARFDQSRNLDGVIRECASLGYIIFSHSCEWRYSFQTESRNDIVVLPGLERLGRREGEMYDSPRVVAWPMVVAWPVAVAV